MKTNERTLIDLINPYRSVSIIGMAKNVGKTTTLNHLICKFAKSNTTLALTSIGRDGEDTDVITHTKKPTIFIHKGTIIATAEKLLGFGDISKEILLVTKMNTPMGRVIIVRATSDGFVQIGGPSMTTQIAKLKDEIDQFGVDKMIVDGAISRKTLANPHITEATILCTGTSLNQNIQVVINETQHLVEMLTLPQVKDQRILQKIAHNTTDEKVIKAEEFIYVQGAVSEAYISQLIMSNYHLKNVYLIAEDASKIFIKPSTYEKLRIKKAKLMVLNPINLVALTVNPISPNGIHFDRVEFLEKMKASVRIPVFDCLQGDAYDG